ncbi:MAG: mechanosensitive ion channel family protein, partial [Alphaproteobacteria bacterium]
MREAWVIPGLGWVPAWMIGVAVLVAVAIVAASVHGLVLRLVFRVLPERLVFTRMLLDRTRGPSRLALMIFAVSVALPLVPLDDPTTAYVAHGLSLAFIALVGWMALAALDLATTLYLRRFRTDIADNLLARKHVTQTRILKRVAALLVVLVTVSVGLMTFEPVRQYGVSLLAAGGAAGLIVGLAA